MNIPTIDLSTVLFLFYLLAFLLGARGFTTHLRDGAETHPSAAQHTAPRISDVLP